MTNNNSSRCARSSRSGSGSGSSVGGGVSCASSSNINSSSGTSSSNCSNSSSNNNNSSSSSSSSSSSGSNSSSGYASSSVSSRCGNSYGEAQASYGMTCRTSSKSQEGSQEYATVSSVFPSALSPSPSSSSSTSSSSSRDSSPESGHVRYPRIHKAVTTNTLEYLANLEDVARIATSVLANDMADNLFDGYIPVNPRVLARARNYGNDVKQHFGRETVAVKLNRKYRLLLAWKATDAPVSEGSSARDPTVIARGSSRRHYFLEINIVRSDDQNLA